jgi:hypothetical protein
MKKSINNPVIWFLVLLSGVPLWAISQETNTSPVFKQEELDQLLAPIALYPDALLSQILMASTYPIEVVQADRWAKQNKDLSGDALTAALEKQTWDPSVKSLVNFPQVLASMSEKTGWTQKLGNAFIAQQKDVMDSVQKLRKKAEEHGSLKTTNEQVIKDEQGAVVIEPNDQQVVNVPEYDTSEVYGTWWYPVYPPYYFYRPEVNPLAPRVNPLSGPGVTVGPAWGYAWGNCDWQGGNIGVDLNRNLNTNPGINREKYSQQYREGTWQHDPQHRRGTPYRDQATAQKFNRASTADAVKSREAYRGRAEQARREQAGRGADRLQGRSDTGQRGDLKARDRTETRDISSRDLSNRSRPVQGEGMDRGEVQNMNRGGAFQDMDRGNAARDFSNRGQMSRQSMPRPTGGFRGGRR